MDYRCMVEGLCEIGKFFGEDYKDDAIKAVQSLILLEPNQAMVKAYNRVVSEFPQRFLPPLAKVRDIILQEGKKIREAEAIQREQEDRRQRTETPESLPKGHTEYSRACCSFLKAAFGRYHTLDELRKMAEDGERRFPGRGFDAWLKGSLNKGKVLPIDRMQKASGEERR